MSFITLGCELEVMTLDREGGAFPFRHAFHGMREILAQCGVSFELGPSQAEVCSEVATDGMGIVPSIEKGLDVIRTLLGKNGNISTEQYLPEFACSGSEMLTDKTLSARHKAILHGLRREAPERWQLVGRIGGAQATHFHLGWKKPDGTPWSFDPREVTEVSEIANLVVNYLNAIAPYHVCAVTRHYGMPDPTERIRLWFEYSAPWRMPQYEWYTRESRIEYFRSVPRLIGLRGGTSGNDFFDWIVLPERGSEPWNVIDAGVQRDLVRLSPPRDEKPWTIEFRPFPAFPKMKWIAEAGDGLIRIVEEVFEHAKGGDIEDVDGLFRTMHNRFPSLPRKRPTKDEWLGCLGL